MQPKIFHSFLIAAVLSLASSGSLSAGNNYLVHNLVADVPGAADHLDHNLVDAWGIAESATGPFWLGNHTGTSTIYDTSGMPMPLVVSVPSASGTANGAVTGVIYNGTSSFIVSGGAPAVFLFCTEDGTLSGWNASVDPMHARLMVDNSASGASYKGCAVGGSAGGPAALCRQLP